MTLACNYITLDSREDIPIDENMHFYVYSVVCMIIVSFRLDSSNSEAARSR